VHWWPAAATPAITPTVSLQADSHFHGAALALRHFLKLGYDIGTPLAHVDMTDADGARQVLLVEEVLDWLQNPKQAEFCRREGLAALLQ
jgi:hypothetical protein